MVFWAIIVHFNRSVTVQCNVALDGLVNFHICIYIYIYILNMYCGGQLYPVLKPRWKRPGPVSDLICTGCMRRGQAQRPI